MAATIYYRISEGTPPFTVVIDPAVAPDQVRSTTGDYFFDNVPDGSYEVTVTDSLGFYTSFEVSVVCETTTTTTIESTTSTTTSTTLELTTSTTTIEDTTTTTTTTIP